MNRRARPAIAVPPDPPPVVLAEAALVEQLQAQLLGRVQGDAKAAPDPTAPVVWTEAGDEVLVHRDSLRLVFAPGALAVMIDLETVETGRQSMLVAIALADTLPVKKVPLPPVAAPPGRGARGDVGGPVPPPVLAAPGTSGLFAVTDRDPAGEPRLVARWGAQLQQAVWSGLLAIATAHASAQGRAPGGFAVDHVKRALYLFPAPGTPR